MPALKHMISHQLRKAGITLNGQAPWDIQVHNEALFNRVWRQAELGLGEAYMDGWWSCERLDTFFERVLRAELDKNTQFSFFSRLQQWLPKIFNYQTKKRAPTVAEKHYDLDNDLFERMLDSHLQYSCGYWKEATTLEEAQLAKLNLICKKLQLQPGMNLLDIGCGWGGLAKFAAENYGVKVTGITLSKQQCNYAEQACQGLDVDICIQDYRDVSKHYDRIVSVGMFEHVGHMNYRTYMKKINQILKEDGLFLLHTIGNNDTIYTTNAWVNKYIFPNGMLPSIAQIGTAAENLLVMEDWHNFGADYDKTLMSWYANFLAQWKDIKHRFDERFYRMWTYYLLSSAGGFRARNMQLWQVVFSKSGITGGYQAPR